MSTTSSAVHGPGYSGANGLNRNYDLPAGQAFSDDFHIFVATYTFVYGEEARQRAWRLGQKWLEGKQGAVVVFDKGGGGTSPAVGLIWQQDDQRALQDRTIQGILAAASSAASAQPTEAPAKQISAAVQELVAGYGRVRPVLEEGRRALLSAGARKVVCLAVAH